MDKRLREALATLQVALNKAKSRLVDLAHGEHCSVLGVDFRRVRRRRGVWRAWYPPMLKKRTAVLGIAGNGGSLLGVSRHVERSGRTMLRSRSQKGHVRWEACLAIKRRDLLQRPKRSLPYTRLKQYAVL